MSYVRKLLPPLVSSLRKGSCGKIAIIGGSEEYTGAPVFAALSALRLGADLVHIFCSPKAMNVIKTFSPDFIVHSYSAHNLMESFERIDAFVIGPGLGRGTYCPLNSDEKAGEQLSVGLLVEKVLEYAKENNKPIVLDGDALWFVSQNPDRFKNSNLTVLTPNIVEFSRLASSVLDVHNVLQLDKENLPGLCCSLSEKMGTTIFLKGETDIVASTNGTFRLLHEEGSPRRCGGQGDTVAGTLGVFLLWALRSINDKSEAKIAAALASSQIVKLCAVEAFRKLGRSMITSDLIQELPYVLKKLDEDLKKNATDMCD
ncbi:unnamed protein product [Auanema sp. JU1783]|nr:unnamed protein product [Auanema sp. JU1783]